MSTLALLFILAFLVSVDMRILAPVLPSVSLSLIWSSSAFGMSTFILGLGFVGLHTTLQLRGTEISTAARGKAFSLFACSLFLGIATGSAAFGWLANGGRYEAMFAVSGLGLIGVGLASARAPHNQARD